jgi:FKBP-type peptidyl-prolyl cis-trans isomerase SlyD
MKITAGSIVRLEYELRIKDGDILESSAKSGPIQYVHGEGRLLPALEKRLEGLAAGQSLSGEIPASEATPDNESLPTEQIARADFPKDAQLAVGVLYQGKTAAGAPINLRIVAMDDTTVTVRLLPAIAGKDLSFKVKVILIEDPVSHKREVVVKKPPPLPAEALDLEVDPTDD